MAGGRAYLVLGPQDAQHTANDVAQVCKGDAGASANTLVDSQRHCTWSVLLLEEWATAIVTYNYVYSNGALFATNTVLLATMVEVAIVFRCLLFCNRRDRLHSSSRLAFLVLGSLLCV